MDISDNESVDFRSIERVNVSSDKINKLIKIIGLFNGFLFHGMFIAIFDSMEYIFHPPCPPYLGTYDGCHG
jgi:hypothetical protein